MSLLLGCIADDYTGATDLGAMLARVGLRVVVRFGVPGEAEPTPECDALVVALKSRSIPAPDAVAQSFAALKSLRRAGAKRFFFKYCSTFDSTDRGNIGPVAESLADRLGAERVVFSPAFPENGRTVYRGHLFVGGRLLHESGMERHPLNPMTDADLVRVLGRQTTVPVGLVTHEHLEASPEELAAVLESFARDGTRFLVADALSDRHLGALAAAVEGDALVTGGSAMGHAIAARLVGAGHVPHGIEAGFEAPEGRSAIIAGSCSPATQRQIRAIEADCHSMRIDPISLSTGTQSVSEVLDWAKHQPAGRPLLVFSTADPDTVAAAHREIGLEKAAALVEDSLACIAEGLVGAGFTRLVVAGGETSGAVTRELGVEAVRIGPEIAPGVPWLETVGSPRLALALKSGNFGSDDFFREALGLLE